MGEDFRKSQDVIAESDLRSTRSRIAVGMVWIADEAPFGGISLIEVVDDSEYRKKNLCSMSSVS